MRDGRHKSRPGLSGSAWCGPSGLSKFAASLELLAAVAGYGYVQGSLLCMLPWTAGTSWPCMVPTRFRKCPAGSYCSTLWVSLSGTLFLGSSPYSGVTSPSTISDTSSISWTFSGSMQELFRFGLMGGSFWLIAVALNYSPELNPMIDRSVWLWYKLFTVFLLGAWRPWTRSRDRLCTQLQVGIVRSRRGAVQLGRAPAPSWCHTRRDGRGAAIPFHTRGSAVLPRRLLGVWHQCSFAPGGPLQRAPNL